MDLSKFSTQTRALRHRTRGRRVHVRIEVSLDGRRSRSVVFLAVAVAVALPLHIKPHTFVRMCIHDDRHDAFRTRPTRLVFRRCAHEQRLTHRLYIGGSNRRGGGGGGCQGVSACRQPCVDSSQPVSGATGIVVPWRLLRFLRAFADRTSAVVERRVCLAPHGSHHLRTAGR
ncbi:hypothetical protein B0H11DRAFT_2095048 [Mycena galericulata]|nr:hypothetical protein B0H11DRAFT_2095048 [Mycena galericulata]